MKSYLLLTVASFVTFNVATIQTLPATSDGINGSSLNQGDEGNIATSKSSDNNPNRIHFYLYTQDNFNEPFEIDMNNAATLLNSSFDFKNPTTFMIHGWQDQYTGKSTELIRKALFEGDGRRKLNFISVDWRVYSHFENYTISKQLCSLAGKIVAKFIDWMNENAHMRFDTLTLYGHSMGSQVAGLTGKKVRLGRIHTIVAMDPAYPLFQYSSSSGRLAATDAEYVETIHTNGGQWGFFEPIGQTAFYPNGGKYQVGCGIDLDGTCSHQRTIDYLAEALSGNNEFYAVKCDQLSDVEEKKCDGYESVIRMADPANAKKPRGIYYLETNAEAPFAKGNTYVFKKQSEIQEYFFG